MAKAKIKNTSHINDTDQGIKMANSKRKCKYCKKSTREYIVVNMSAFCSFDEAVKYASENKSKGAAIIKKSDDKKHAKRKKEFNDNDKSLRDKEAQKAFNAFIRMNDDNLPCISCNEFRQQTAVSSGSNWHAGHYKTRGARPSLRFNEDNCHKQCAHCNNFLSGNIENYRINLIKKIGLDKVEWLEGPHEPKKYTCAELKEIELLYKQKLKDLI